MKRPLFILFLILIVTNGVVWFRIAQSREDAVSKFHMLDVGQGDSSLIEFPNGVQIITDTGPDRSVLQSLERVLPADDRYIDIAIVSHPQLDHFNGFNELLRHYTFGAFIVNGRDDDGKIPEWEALKTTLTKEKIPVIVLGAGDNLKIGEEGNIELLSPGPEFVQSGELNDTGFVEYVRTLSFTALLMADTGINVEEFLMTHELVPHVDILKIGHHGSKYSSGERFLEVVEPHVVVIGVGEKNRYGHPAPETLARLAAATKATVFRTDQNGTISIIGEGKRVKVYVEK